MEFGNNLQNFSTISPNYASSAKKIHRDTVCEYYYSNMFLRHCFSEMPKGVFFLFLNAFACKNDVSKYFEKFQ